MNNIPEHLMAQAETRTINGRTRQVIPVIGMTTMQVKAVFSLKHRSIAQEAVERGFYIVQYRKRSVCPGSLDVNSAYKMARWWFYKKLAGRLPWWAEADDMIQEAVTRLAELAGDPRMEKMSFRYNVIKQAMYDYIRRNRKHEHEDESMIDSPRNRVPEPWKFGTPEECQACHASPDTWRRKHAATEAMCRVIEAKGITPMERAA